MDILFQTESDQAIKGYAKKHGLTFVRWINGNAGHELAETKDGKLVEIKFTYRDNNPLNRIYNVIPSTLTK
jgi:hypothetical protein